MLYKPALPAYLQVKLLNVASRRCKRRRAEFSDDQTLARCHRIETTGHDEGVLRAG